VISDRPRIIDRIDQRRRLVTAVANHQCNAFFYGKYLSLAD
jgi:hypothetical protein